MEKLVGRGNAASFPRIDIPHHVVWIAKYRKPFLYGDAAVRVRDLIREICKTLDAEIVKGHVSRDYIYLSVSVRPICRFPSRCGI